MEPISLAVGVVPLAINIVQMSSAIRDKIATYKSAPSEIQSIVEKISLVGYICERLDLEVALCASQSRFQSEMLERALGMCCSSICSFQNDFEKIVRSENPRKQSLAYLFGKSHIEKQMCSLNDSINMLNTCINMSLLSSSTAQKSATCDGFEAPLDSLGGQTSISRNTTSPLALTTSQPRRRLRERQMTTYKNAFYHFESISTITQESTNEEGDCSQSRSYLFGLPLIGTYISLAMRYGALNPFELSIDVPHHIYEVSSKGLYDRLYDELSSGQSVEDELQWANKLQLRPGTQLIPRTGRPKSALGILMGTSNKKKAFKYLLNKGGKRVIDGRFLSLPTYRSRTEGSDDFLDDPICLYAEARAPLMTLEEYREIMLPGSHPAFYAIVFDICKAFLLEIDQQEFLLRTILPTVNDLSCCRFGRASNSMDSFVAYESLVQKIVEHGFDVHDTFSPFETPFFRYAPFPMLSILAFLLAPCWSCQPWANLEAACTWLEILSHAGIDAHQYLDRELEILPGVQDPHNEHLTKWPSYTAREKLRTMHGILHTSEGEDVDELYEVFPALRYGTSYLLGSYKDFSHIGWKRQRVDGIPDSWPCLLETRCSLEADRGLRNLPEKKVENLKSFDRFLELMRERFHRNQQRKWKNLQKTRGISQGQKMPGSWAMEWWEYRGPW